MVDNEPHAVVRLLLKRMESHPEEFKRNTLPSADRWNSIVSDVIEWGNEADTNAINAALRNIRLGEAHEDMMDELVNGPERRRKVEEEIEYERQMVMQSALAQQQAVQQKLAAQQNAYGQYQNQLGQYQNAAGAQGLGIGTQSPSQPLVIGTGKEAMRIQANGDIQIGNETLNEGLLKNIKKALKL
jgi:hypothetical protein